MSEININPDGSAEIDGDTVFCEDCLSHHNRKALATWVDTPCPYMEEIHDKIERCNLCEDCYHERCMDI